MSCSFIRGGSCPNIGDKSLQVELSKVKDTVYQCVTLTSDGGAKLNLETIDEGVPLPDSRYITLRKQKHPLVIAEIHVYGGKGRWIKESSTGNSTPAFTQLSTVNSGGPTTDSS